MRRKQEVLLLLGGNTGDPERTLAAAEVALNEQVGTVLARSRHHWTEPLGFTDERLFLNTAILISTTLEPLNVLQQCLAIETDLGRRRVDGPRYTARPVDIDILLIGEEVISAPGLQVPHPAFHERAFALAPAADIAPSARHPLLDRSVLQLLNELRPA